MVEFFERETKPGVPSILVADAFVDDRDLKDETLPLSFSMHHHKRGKT